MSNGFWVEATFTNLHYRFNLVDTQGAAIQASAELFAGVVDRPEHKYFEISHRFHCSRIVLLVIEAAKQRAKHSGITGNYSTFDSDRNVPGSVRIWLSNTGAKRAPVKQTSRV